MNFLDKIPKINLIPFKTPFYKLNSLSNEFNSNVYIKRDDLTGVGPGGNKVRSLEYIMGEALLIHKSDLIFAGGPGQSNLCTIAASTCNKLGVNCELIHNCESPNELTGNLLLNKILGVKSHFIGNVSSETRENFIESLFNEYVKKGHNPYIIKNGATSGVGCLGYVNCVYEIKNQCKNLEINKLTIFAPGGNGGVAAGLIYGNYLAGSPFDLVIISVEDDAYTLANHIEKTIKEAEYLTGIEMKSNIYESARIIDKYRGLGWGCNTEDSEKEVFSFAKKEGIFIENIYTSKVVVGMKDMLSKSEVTGNVCFLHTGGFSSLFAQY